MSKGLLVRGKRYGNMEGYDYYTKRAPTFVGKNYAAEVVVAGKASMPLVNKIAVHRNELRMLKRTDEKRAISKKKYKGGFGFMSFAAQVATNTVNLGRNAVEGVLRSEVNVTAMTCLRTYQRLIAVTAVSKLPLTVTSFKFFFFSYLLAFRLHVIHTA